MRFLMKKTTQGCLLALLIAGCGPARLHLPTNYVKPADLAHLPALPAKLYPIHTPQYSGYTAMCVGLDDKVYIGSAEYYDYGQWLQFDPRTKQFKVVVDTADLLGESLFDVSTNSKTHTRLAVGPDGKIWGGTKQGHELFDTRPEIGEESPGFPGGHIISYDPATGVARDYGIAKPYDGLVNGIIDAKRNRIYFKTEPRLYLLIFELDTHQIINKGYVNSSCRFIEFDHQDNVWIPMGGWATNDLIVKYDVQKDELCEYTIVPETPDDKYVPAYYWIAGHDRKQLYSNASPMIQMIDLARADDEKRTVPIRNVCRAMPDGITEGFCHRVMARDRKGRIYWEAVFSGARDKKGYCAIMRWDPHKQNRECLGYVVNVDDHKPMGITPQGWGITADGTLYIKSIYPYILYEFPGLTCD